MEIFATQQFEQSYQKLIKKKDYKHLELLLHKFLFTNKSNDRFKEGNQLKTTAKLLFRKKRLGGKGGFRLYHIYIIIDNKIYLGDIHPKTGKLGKSTFKSDEIEFVLKNIIQEKIDNKLLKVVENKAQNRIEFQRI